MSETGWNNHGELDWQSNTMKISSDKFDSRFSLKGTNYNMSVVSNNSKQVWISEMSDTSNSNWAPSPKHLAKSLNTTEHFEKNPFVKKKSKNPKKHLNIMLPIP